MHIPIVETVIYALVGGIIPALIWLWFWLKEDSVHPEPKFMIIVAFIAGMLAVPISLFSEIWISGKFFSSMIETPNILLNAGVISVLALFSLAAVEETGKYLAALFSSLRTKFYDEPIDSMIYLITAGLGFAALENTLFLIKFISEDIGLGMIFLNNNLRFMGATLLHVVASGIFGGIIAFSYFSRNRLVKFSFVLIGLITATSLHALFNFSIIIWSESPIKIFSLLWVFAIIVIIMFERVKRIKK